MQEIDIFFKPNQTEEQKSLFLISEIERIKNSGLKIVGVEPIERIRVTIVGRRHFVE